MLDQNRFQTSMKIIHMQFTKTMLRLLKNLEIHNVILYNLNKELSFSIAMFSHVSMIAVLRIVISQWSLSHSNFLPHKPNSGADPEIFKRVGRSMSATVVGQQRKV